MVPMYKTTSEGRSQAQPFRGFSSAYRLRYSCGSLAQTGRNTRTLTHDA